MEFDPNERSQRHYNGYGPAKFPDPRDPEIDDFVANLQRGGPQAVQAALASVSEKGRQVLATYAERAASRAVREKNPQLLGLALVALVVGGLDENTLEALLRMPLIEDAACRLGSEPSDLFEATADTVGHPGSVNLMLWLARPPEDRTLESMGFEAGHDESGFRYHWTA